MRALGPPLFLCEVVRNRPPKNSQMELARSGQTRWCKLKGYAHYPYPRRASAHGLARSATSFH
jgi:hypothetical protein